MAGGGEGRAIQCIFSSVPDIDSAIPGAERNSDEATGNRMRHLSSFCLWWPGRVDCVEHSFGCVWLERTTQRLRMPAVPHVVDAVQDYAIFMLDPKGHVASWNSGGERIKGYRASEIIGRHYSLFFTDEDRRLGKPEEQLRLATEHGRVEQEGWRVRKDGSRFWANITLTAIREANGELVGFGKVTRDFTERRKMEKRVAESEKALRELSLHLLHTQDEERRRIGRDLHDSLGQYLAALKMRLESLAKRSPADEHLTESIRLTDESIKEVRTLSYLLYPPLLDESGLSSAVQWYLDGLGTRSHIAISYECDAEFPRLRREVEMALSEFYRSLLRMFTAMPAAQPRRFVF